MDPGSTNLVIYHAQCSDGFSAAWAAWKLLGHKAQYHAGVHGEPPPDVKGKRVVCVDFSYKKDVVRKLQAEAESFIIIDHHKSAMIELCDVPNAHFDLTKSGAMLSWEYFHPGKEPPKFIKYVQDRDLWLWELPYSKEFCTAFEMVPFEFEEYDAFCDDSTFDDAVERGSFILAYKREYVARISSTAKLCNIAGYSALVVNTPQWISEIGNSLSKNAQVGVIWFYDHETQITRVSLRSLDDDVDVSEIAKKFGGGGHKTASGFTLKGLTIESVLN